MFAAEPFLLVSVPHSLRLRCLAFHLPWTEVTAAWCAGDLVWWVLGCRFTASSTPPPPQLLIAHQLRLLLQHTLGTRLRPMLARLAGEAGGLAVPGLTGAAATSAAGEVEAVKL